VPKTKSAKKRVRQAEKRRLRNKAVKSRLKTEAKKLRVTKLLHRAAAKGVIHKNKAARVQSKLQKHLNIAAEKE